MNLGKFRELTKDLSDDVEMFALYDVDHSEYKNIRNMSVGSIWKVRSPYGVEYFGFDPTEYFEDVRITKFTAITTGEIY